MTVRRDTVGDHWKDRRIHPDNVERHAGREIRQDFINLRLHLEQSRDHIFAPIEIDEYFSAAPTRRRPEGSHSWDRTNRFFNRSRNLDRHPLCRPISRIQIDANPRKTELRKQRDRKPKAARGSGDSEDDKKRKQEARVPVCQSRKIHLITFTCILSASSRFPTVTTWSPSRNSGSITSTCESVCNPISTVFFTAQ